MRASLRFPHDTHGLRLHTIPRVRTARSINTTDTTYWHSYLPAWQGAYVFEITSKDGIVFRGGITQMQNGQLPTSHNNLFITRTLYTGNVLYAVSNNMVQMNSLTDLSKLGSVGLA